MRSINDKIKHLREESGFTLTEAIVVLIVMALLAAVTVPALVPWYQSYKATERQYNAENIYMSMNNSFTNIKTGGWLGTDDSTASADGDTVVSRYKYWQEQGSVWSAEQGNATIWDDGIVAISSDVAASDVLDYIQRGTGNTYSTAGFQTITDGQGHYVVELDPITGYVYGVFYSESKTFSGSEGKSLYESAATVRNDQNALGDMSIAYYGGTILGTFDDDDVTLQIGYFEFDGEESKTSAASIYGSDTFTITVRNGKAVNTFPAETTTLNTDASDAAENIVDTAYGVLVTPTEEGNTWTPSNPSLYDKCYVNDSSGKQKIFYRLKTSVITDTYDNPSSGLSYTNSGSLTKWTVRAGGKTYKFNVNQNFAATTSLAENPLTGADVSSLYNLKCYQVRTDEQMQHIGTPYGQTSGSAKYLTGYVFNQTHNIAIDGEWTPIGADTDEVGTASSAFASAFNGSVKFIKGDTTTTNQYTVSLGASFAFSRPAISSSDFFTDGNSGNYKYCEGLFATVSGSVNNLSVVVPAGSSVSPMISSTTADTSGAYGLVSGAVISGGSIANITISLENDADLDLGIDEKSSTRYNFLGAITGANLGTISVPSLSISSGATLSVDGSVSGTSAKWRSYTGGLIGNNISSGSISSPVISGSGSLTVSNDGGNGDTFVGGLIGYTGGALNSMSVDFGNVNVNVSATNVGSNKAYAGGLTGYSSSTLTNISATGNYSVSASTQSNEAQAGGIVGQANGAMASVSMTAKSGLSVTASVSSSGGGLSRAGGIVGSVTSNNVNLTDCSFAANDVSNATISATSLGSNGESVTSGLLAGYLERGTVSYTDANIKAVSLSNSTIDVKAYRPASESIPYAGEVSKTAAAGGIIGYAYSETVTNPSIVIENKSVLNIGSATNNANRVGVIIGYHASSSDLSFGTASGTDLSGCSIQVLRSAGETAGQRLEQINLYQNTDSAYYVCSGNDSSFSEHNVLGSGPDTAKRSTYLNGLVDITLDSSAPYKQMYPLSYIVTFDGNGTAAKPATPAYQYQLVDYGGYASTTGVSAPSRDGYTFLGWYADADHTAVFDFSTAITQDTTIYAGWTTSDVTVTFDSRGGTDVPSQSLESGEKATEPTAPTRDGYTFDYWYTSNDGGETELTQYDFDTPVTEDITLYAKWTPKIYIGYFEFSGTSSYTLYDMYAYRIQDSVGSTINNTLITSDKAPADNISYAGYGALISADVASNWYNSLSSTEKGQYSSTPTTVGPYKFYEFASHTATSATARGWNKTSGSTGTSVTIYLNQNFANAVNRTALTKSLNIRTAAQMQHIGKPYSSAAGATSVASTYLSGYTFTMTHNIKADGDWTPIGITGTSTCSFFQGTFNGSNNGSNYSISLVDGFNFAQCGYQDGGLAFNDNSGTITGTRWTKFEGLFAGVGSSSATVSNVRIVVAEDLSSPFGNMSSVSSGDGAMFGLLTGALVNSGTVKGCSLETAEGVTASLVLPKFSVQKSSNSFAKGASVSIGGLVGTIQVGTVTDCSMSLGKDSKLIIDNTNATYSGGDSSVPHSKFAGGIIGCAVASNTSESSTVGTIGTSGTGGFTFGGSGELVIASAKPSSTGISDTWATYAGGVVGYVNSNFSVNWKTVDFGNAKIGNSDDGEYVVSTSASATSYAGGVLGRYEGSISDLSMTSSSGQVNIQAATTGASSTNNAYAGGFAGYISGGVSNLTLKMEDSALWNISVDTASGTGYMGGLLGYVGGTLTTPKITVKTDSTMNVSTSSTYGSSYASNIRSGAIVGYHNSTATFGKLADGNAAVQLICPDGEKPSQRKETINVYNSTSNVLCGNLDLDHNSLTPGVATGMRNVYLDGLGDPTLTDGSYTYTQLYPMMYTVAFDNNGHGTTPDNRLVDPNGKISSTGTDISATGYIFKGWYTDDDTFIDKWNFDTDTVTSSKVSDYTFTLHAKWEADFSDITVSGFNTVYDGKTHSITVSSSTGAAIDSYQVYADAACTTLLTSFKNVADSHDRVYVKVTRNGESKVYGTDTVIPAIITQKDIIVTPTSDQSKTYGDADSTLTYGYSVLPSISGETPGFSGALSRESGENVGSYEVTQGTLALSDNGLFIANNYNMTFVEGIQFTIDRKTVTVAADDKNKVYGEADPELTATVSGLVGMDIISYAVSRESGENVGAYEINATGAAQQGNYNITYSSGTFAIVKSHNMVVTATGYSGKYDGTSHTYTVAPSVNVAGTTTYSYSTDGGKTWSNTAPTVKNVSDSTTVTVKAVNDNYEDATCTYDLTVTKRSITMTSADDTKYYDGAALTNDTITITGDGFVSGEGATYTVSGSQTNAGSTTNTFTYSLNNGTLAENYDISTIGGTLTVLPLEVSISVDDKTKTYGNSDPAFTATVNGVLSGESISYTLSREKGENVGTYKISAAYAAEQGNYKIVSATDGTLTIEKAKTLAVSCGGYTGTYDGNSHSVNASANITNGTTIYYSLTDPSIGAATWQIIPPAVTDADTTKVWVKAVNPNYEDATCDYTLTIAPKPVTVTANAVSKTYGDVDPALSATVNGMLGSDTITYTVSRITGEDAGTYTIVPTGTVRQGNYTVTYVNGTFTINRKALTVSKGTVSSPYTGGAVSTTINVSDADVTVTGLVSGDTLSIANATISGTEVGIYSTVNPSYSWSVMRNGANVTDNYVLNSVTGTLNITPVIIYDKNGGSGTMASTPAMSDGTYANPGTATVSANGFTAPSTETFNGWNTAANGSGTAYSANDTVTLTENLILYAQWKSSATLTLATSYVDYQYYDNTDYVGKTSVANINTTGHYTTPTRSDGWTFAGWYAEGATTAAIDADGSIHDNSLIKISGQGYLSLTTPVTLYARWTRSALKKMDSLSDGTFAISVVEGNNEYFATNAGTDNQVGATAVTLTKLITDDTENDYYSYGTTFNDSTMLWMTEKDSTYWWRYSIKSGNYYWRQYSRDKTVHGESMKTLRSTWVYDGQLRCNGEGITTKAALYRSGSGMATSNNSTTVNLYTKVTATYTESSETVTTLSALSSISSFRALSNAPLSASAQNNIDVASQTGTGTLTINTSNDANISNIEADSTNVTKNKQEFTKVSIAFSANGGKGEMDEQVFEYGTAQNLKSNEFSREGYAFTGWNTEEDGSGDAYDDGAYVTLDADASEDITLYAQWEKAWTISFEANGGKNEIQDIQCVKGISLSLPQGGVYKSGATLISWNTESDGSGDAYDLGEEIEYKELDDDITLYAQWEEEPSLYNLLITGSKTETIFSQFVPEETVSITLKVDDGYEIAEINGKDDLADFMQNKSKISFVMPKRDVNLIVGVKEKEPKAEITPQLIG